MNSPNWNQTACNMLNFETLANILYWERAVCSKQRQQPIVLTSYWFFTQEKFVVSYTWRNVSQLCCYSISYWNFSLKREQPQEFAENIQRFLLRIARKDTTVCRQICAMVLPWRNKMFVELLKQCIQDTFLCAGDEFFHIPTNMHMQCKRAIPGK